MTRILCDEQLLFRPAVPADAPRIQTIIRQAQAQMRAAGSLQWQNGYPGPEHIAADLLRGYGRVLWPSRSVGRCRSGCYGAVSFDGEPAYGAIEGGWSSDDAYVVLHRLAVADEVKRQGVATAFFPPHGGAGPGPRRVVLPRRYQFRQPLYAAPART